MSIGTLETLAGKFELYKLIDEGLDAMTTNDTRPFRDVLNNIRKDIQN